MIYVCTKYIRLLTISLSLFSNVLASAIYTALLTALQMSSSTDIAPKAVTRHYQVIITT
jgi:F0F1-type ATP synthase membrane subunit a